MPKYSLYEIIKPKLGYKARKNLEDIMRYRELMNLTNKDEED